MIEARPAPPVGRVVWVAGYWHWTGMQFTWIPGHWEGERPGAVWRAPRYLLRDGVYFYEPGDGGCRPRLGRGDGSVLSLATLIPCVTRSSGFRSSRSP